MTHIRMLHKIADSMGKAMHSPEVLGIWPLQLAPLCDNEMHSYSKFSRFKGVLFTLSTSRHH